MLQHLHLVLLLPYFGFVDPAVSPNLELEHPTQRMAEKPCAKLRLLHGHLEHVHIAFSIANRPCTFLRKVVRPRVAQHPVQLELRARITRNFHMILMRRTPVESYRSTA
eukprot:9503190-Pyramimonas_sp.AAC.2